MKSGDMVRFVESADKNTPGWRGTSSVGIIVRPMGFEKNPKWYHVLIGQDVTKVFHKDIELIPEEE